MSDLAKIALAMMNNPEFYAGRVADGWELSDEAQKTLAALLDFVRDTESPALAED